MAHKTELDDLQLIKDIKKEVLDKVYEKMVQIMVYTHSDFQFRKDLFVWIEELRSGKK